MKKVIIVTILLVLVAVVSLVLFVFILNTKDQSKDQTVRFYNRVHVERQEFQGSKRDMVFVRREPI
jgi:flagellar basal body-associated protein FliL